MSRGTRGWALVLAATMAGCGSESNRVADPVGPALVLPVAYKAGEQGVLRVKTDGARDRLWVLSVNDLRIYDRARKQLVRRIALPNWSVARFICPPDMVLDGSGSATVSSNSQAKLWWIDADTLEVKEREIRLYEREEWDVGFGAVALAADGSLLALSSTGGWLWNVNVEAGTGRLWNWGTPLLNACDLTPIE
jgi:hypothetical protein